MNDQMSFFELGCSVAALLKWKVEVQDAEYAKEWPNDGRVDLIAPDGMKLRIMKGTWGAKNGRILIHAFGPTNKRGQTTYSGISEKWRNEITVAEGSTPEKIAKEISGRLMKAWRPLWNKLVERSKEDDNYEDSMARNYEEVCKVIGTDGIPEHLKSARRIYWSPKGEYITGTVESNGITFDHMRLSFDVGLKVLEFLKNLLEPAPVNIVEVF